MDPLSVTASIIAVIQLTTTVVGYLNDIGNASKDQRHCAIEASNVLSLLTSLRYRIEEGSYSYSADPWFTAVRALAVENGPLDQYKAVLESLIVKTGPRDGASKISNALLWKFNKGEAAAILTKIERLKSLTNIALEMDHFKLSQAIKMDTQYIPGLVRDVEVIRYNQDNQYFQAITDWLSVIDFAAQQTDFMHKRQEGTGTWFIQSQVFTNWLSGSKTTLFCPGIPGAGKTMISSIVIDHLWRTRSQSETGIAYLYCNYKKYEEQKAIDLLSALLKQLVQELTFVPDTVQTLYEQHQKRRTRPSLGEISRTLHSVVSSYREVFIVVDALDECMDGPEYREHLLSVLKSLQDSNIRLMVTSRPITKIAQEFKYDAILEIVAHEEDVKRFVEQRVTSLAGCVSRDPSLKQLVISEIARAVDGMFLLAQLHLDSLVGKTTPKAIKSGLASLPKGAEALPRAYKKAIERIENQAPEHCTLAKEVLSWIVCAKRPLSMQELQHALAIEIGEPQLDKENITDESDIVSVCAGLITVDEVSNIIRLVHYTAQEFFERTRTVWIPDALHTIVSKCITYLLFDTFTSGYAGDDAEFQVRLVQNPFLNYAAHYWGTHTFHLYSEDDNDSVSKPIKLALLFLRNQSSVSCCSQIQFASSWKTPGYSKRSRKHFTGLHLASYFGLSELCTCLLQGQQDDIEVDSQDADGRTPLSWAAEQGHEAVIKQLLSNDLLPRRCADPDLKNHDKRTPLSFAAEYGHLNVVRLLLDRGVEVKSMSRNGRDALSYAAGGGHASVVELLLTRSDVNSTSNNSRTPLSWAAGNGHTGVVNLLLQHQSINVDRSDNSGRTTLSWAAGRGYLSVVELLLSRSNVNAVSNNGRTPLSWAAGNGYTAVLRLLLGHQSIDVDLPDNSGRTPLSWAASGGHSAIVKLLLGRSDINSACKNGRTPLSWAAGDGHTIVVHQLLDVPGIMVEYADKSGRSPLSLAVESGHVAIMKALLDHKDILVNSRDERLRTPLCWAAKKGQTDAVQLLLDQKEIDVNLKDHSDRTPLCWAAERGYLEVVERLLKHHDIDINARTKFGQTPFSLAAEWGHKDMVELFLRQPNVVADSRSNSNRTPLSWAASRGQVDIVKLLLARDDVMADFKSSVERSPLSWAAGRGHVAVVQLLLNHPNVVADSGDNIGRTPLSWASGGGHAAVVMQFIERDDVDANSMDRDGRTPLSWAAEGGHEEVAKLLRLRSVII